MHRGRGSSTEFTAISVKVTIKTEAQMVRKKGRVKGGEYKEMRHDEGKKGNRQAEMVKERSEVEPCQKCERTSYSVLYNPT